MSYESAFLTKLETILTGMGGAVPSMTTPTSFEARSLELLDSIAAVAGGGGFDYDQESAPSSPSAGNLWIERRSNGLVRAVWQWTGSLWLSMMREVYSGFHSNISTSATGSATNARLANATGSTPTVALVVERVNFSGRVGSGVDGSNYWTIGVSSLTRSAGAINSYTEISGTSVVTTANGDFNASVEPNVSVSNSSGLASLATYATLTGTAGALAVIVVAETRRVRP
jgi:hypothetical protein